MLLFMPERLYKPFTNDEKYTELTNKASNEIFNLDDIDFLKTTMNYNSESEYLNELQQYILDNLTEEYKMEFNILNNPLEYENEFEQMDKETQIIWLYEMCSDSFAYSHQNNRYNNQIIRIYNNFIKPEKEKYSPYLSVIYYFKSVYQKIIELQDKELTVELFNGFIKYEESLFKEIYSYYDSESFKHILYSRREQMLVMFYQWIGQFVIDNDYIKIEKLLNVKQFKYNQITIFKLMLYNIIFNKMIDTCDLNNAKKYFDKIVNMIIYAFQHKEYTLKSMCHYNQSFLENFLPYSLYIYDIVRDFMPNVYNKMKIIEQYFGENERRFYNHCLTNEEKEFYANYLSKNDIFSNQWRNLNKITFQGLDKLYA